MVVVVCRHSGDPDSEASGFSFAHALLRPALECLRRDLLSRAAIDQLHRTVNSRDKDLELLLADGASDRPAGDGADELKGVLQQAIEHVGASTVALIVPDKSIALLRSNTQQQMESVLANVFEVSRPAPEPEKPSDPQLQAMMTM